MRKRRGMRFSSSDQPHSEVGRFTCKPFVNQGYPFGLWHCLTEFLSTQYAYGFDKESDNVMKVPAWIRALGKFVLQVLESVAQAQKNVNDGPIKHVVVLVLENHSFDQMLGCMKEIHPDLDGVDPQNLRSNSYGGRTYIQQPTERTDFPFDPRHEYKHVMTQLLDGNGGFVRDFADHYRDRGADESDYQAVMDYFPRGSLHPLHTLAEHFTICDHWFCSVPGPTWTNRFFVHSGTSLGRVEMGEGWWEMLRLSQGYTQRTIYDEFDDHGITWAIYTGDIPQSALMTNLLQKLDRYRPLDCFYEHASRSEQDFPQYAFIEPRYFLPDQNDDHPPHDAIRAQELIASVYNAIRNNEDLWNSTLLVIFYDEHGGFYDHVPPPGATPPDGLSSEGCRFDRYGVRVPALLISPWVDADVFPTQLDHTSLLRYVSDKWGLSSLTARVREANTFAPAIRSTGRPRTDTPSFIVMPPMKKAPMKAAAITAAPVSEIPLNEHQLALMAFMEQAAGGVTPPETDAAQRMKMAAPPNDPQDAKNKFQRLLQQARQASGSS